MKKAFLWTVAVASIMASCSNEAELNTKQAEIQDSAIGFSAYTSTAVTRSKTTRGVVIDNDEITAAATGSGIGVFAFYQPAVNGTKTNFNTRKFLIPDFMYNQKVYCKTTAGTWEYTPVKYWPNNLNDQLSFFAYAPYEADKAWEDLNISTDAAASKLNATFPIYDDKTAMKDILWADPYINKTKASTTDGAANNPITFNFSHILSKIAVYIGVEQNTATGQPTAWSDGNTTITIDKVELTNLADKYNYTCPINTDGSLATSTWSVGTTTQDIVLSKANGDFATSSAVINSTNYTLAEYKNLLSVEKSGDSFPDETATGDYKNAYLFLAPQTFTTGKEQVVITYTVTTTDENSKANCSTITNVISKDLKDVVSDGFVTGSAYKLNLLIGMNSVKITANVVDWVDTETDVQIDVPANNVVVVSSLSAAQTTVATDSDDPVTVKVTDDAVTNATTSDVYDDDSGNKYLKFELKTTSPENVGFDLPAISAEDATRLGTDTWLITYEENYPTTNVTVNAPEGTKVKIDAPTSHVEVTGTSYAEIIASTANTTLVIPQGTTVDNLIINQGGVEIHGTVTEAQVNGTSETVFVRECEGLSQTVYDALKNYIDTERGYYGVEVDSKWNIVRNTGWIYYYAESFSETEENTITIMTAEELALFAKNVNNDVNYTGYTIKLGDDIDLSEHEWIPIILDEGCATNLTFDGCNHKITGLNINRAENSSALFGNFFSHGTVIKNLTIENPQITQTQDPDKTAQEVGLNYTAALVAHMGCGDINNCKIEGGTISGQDQVGAIVGYLACGSVTGCTVDGTTVSAAVCRAGGIAGKANTDSEYHINNNTVNDATVTSAGYHDDICGAAALVGQIMTGSIWEINNNIITDVTTTTGSNSKFVPVGEFRKGYFKADAVTGGHIVGNEWTVAGAPNSYTMVNPSNTSEYIVIDNAE